MSINLQLETETLGKLSQLSDAAVRQTSTIQIEEKAHASHASAQHLAILETESVMQTDNMSLTR